MNLRLFAKQVGWNNSLILLLVISVLAVFSALIPPFQSPDEPDHIKRAYLLSRGAIILGAPEGQSSGGIIDSGLAAYMDAYGVLPFKPDRKLSADEIESAGNIRWTGIKRFMPLPTTAVYFPVIYMPHVTGLALGESLGLTIETSYLIARFTVLVSILLIFWAAFHLYPVNPLILALLILPMSLFQFLSASLDGMATALAIFSIAAFLRITIEKEKTKSWLFYAFTTSVILVTTSRGYVLPLWGLVFSACFYSKNKKFFYVSILALLFILAWWLIAIETTVDARGRFGTVVPRDMMLSSLSFYIKNPTAFLKVFGTTLSDKGLGTFYRDSFLGRLGWLDTSFSERSYKFLEVSTFLISLLSVSIKKLKTEWVPRLILFFSALASFFLLFFSILILWNPHPATLIRLVQGRYFLIPMLMVAYALAGGQKPYEGIFRKIALLLVIILWAFTIFAMPRLLIERYYLVPEQPKNISSLR